MAINLFGVLLIKSTYVPTMALINHERIHTAQMKEMLYLPFYLCYILEWIVRLILTKGNAQRAYMTISFEKEAYDNADNLDYLLHRSHFAQWLNK